MKIVKKVTAVIMAVIISATAFLPSFAAASSTDAFLSYPEFNSLSEYKNRIREEGYPVFTTDQFMQIYNFIEIVKSILTGDIFYPREHLNVKVDDLITDACNQIYAQCGLDIVTLLTNLPDINEGAEFIVKVFDINTDTIKDEMYQKRDECNKSGNKTLGKVYFFLGAYLSIIDECLFYADPTDNPDVVQVKLKVTFKNGDCEYYYPGIFINTVTGECTNDDDSGLVGLGFNFNLEQMLVYATLDCWMRDFGFCIFYDIAANSMPLLWHYETRRFKFDYNGLEWMIQIWKGNYLITNGAEVGVYNREVGSHGSYYDCATDDQLMEMSLQVYHDDELLVDQPPQMHWWINGFQMNSRRFEPKTLTMKFYILMPDEKMVSAFTQSIANHYKGDVSYSIDGLKVYVEW